VLKNLIVRTLDFIERKASSVAPFISERSLGRPVWSDRDYETFAKEGYKQNGVVYRCISSTTKAAGRIPIKLYREKADGTCEEVKKHPVLSLLKRPNPKQSWSAFIDSILGFYKISGNSYIEGVGPEGKPPLELWPLRPDRMRITPGHEGIEKYGYWMNGREVKKWDVDPITMQSGVLHMLTFNPLDDWYGLSPIHAAAFSIDQHNSAGAWNQALLQNSARPSGAFVYAPDGRAATLTDPQFQRLKNEVDEMLSGPGKARRPMVLDGGLDWKEMGLTPVEMDWLEGKNSNTKDIAMVLHVPGQIIGIEDPTYANYSEARQAFYEDTVVPDLEMLCFYLNTWLLPVYGEADNLYLKPDTDEIPAMAEKRGKKWAMVQGAEFLTVNEKRAALDYEPNESPDANKLYIGATQLPMAAPETETEEGEEGETGEGTPTGGAGGDVQATALNGAQVTSMQEVVQAVADGKLPAEAATNMLIIAFPAVDANLIRAMVTAAESFEPTPDPTPVVMPPIGGKPGAKPPGAAATEVAKAKSMLNIRLEGEGWDKKMIDNFLADLFES
jgi:HK97 family phage portal protein